MHQVGDVVWYGGYNRYLPQGGPRYLARIEELKEARAKIRPLTVALTEATARAATHRKGPSVRARWVLTEYLSKHDGDDK